MGEESAWGKSQGGGKVSNNVFDSFSIKADCFAQNSNGSAVVFAVGRVMQSLCSGEIVGGGRIRNDFVRRGEEEEAYAHEEGCGVSPGMWRTSPELGRPSPRGPPRSNGSRVASREF